MSAKYAHPDRQRSDERGSIVIMTALFMLILFLLVGLCIDVSRIYMVRTELQNAADAAALAGARELNTGTTGIDNAVTRATVVSNTVDFAKLGIRIDTVEFAKQPDGPYLDAATAKRSENVAEIRYVRATTRAANTAILFGVAALGTSHSENRSAVAGMSIGINGFCDYFPIAIAKASPTVPYTLNSIVPVHFKDNTGTTITLPDSTFVVLDTPWVTGNGADETRDAMAGVTPRCTSIGDVLTFSKSPSANAMNGPKQTEDGTNTRFYIYPPGNQLTYDNAKPGTNIYGAASPETLTFQQYKTNNESTPPFRAPAQTGVFDRRLLLIPIIEPIPNTPDNPTGIPSGKVKAFGRFFLKQAVDGNCPRNGPKGTTIPCPAGTTASGDILLEYLGEGSVGRGVFDPTQCSSHLGVPVLYR